MRNYGVIIAARTGSSRLKEKALLPLHGVPMIVFLVRRLLNSRLAEKVVLATTNLAEDDHLADVVANEGISIFRGDENDVVKRYVEAARKFNIEYVVRVTGDCPFTDAETLDYCLNKCNLGDDFDLATTKSFFPVGIDYEIYNTAVMEELHETGKLDCGEREHLTLHFYRYPDRFNIKEIHPLKKWVFQDHSFTVDTPEDYRYAQQLVNSFHGMQFNVENLIKAAKGEN